MALQFREFYKNLTPMKRASMMAVCAVVAIAAVFMALMVSGTDYAPLFTDIPNDQTSLIMQKLQARNIPFKVDQGGKIILVPRDLLSSTQMALMAEIGNA